jgi:hypothetical protein
MDGPGFDLWTRRRFGQAAGGVAASVLALPGFTDSEASKKKRKRRRKRCKKLHDPCRVGGKRKCCGALRCRTSSLNAGIHTFCCKTEGKPCENESDCCDPFLCCGAPGDEVCSQACPSDRDIKTNVGSIDPADMLERVRGLSISTWNYTSDDPSVRHIGPMAQDFSATFGVGADDRHIHPIDGQGVALAAIQGLVAQVEEMHQENARLAARIVALETGER